MVHFTVNYVSCYGYNFELHSFLGMDSFAPEQSVSVLPSVRSILYNKRIRVFYFAQACAVVPLDDGVKS